MEDKEEDQISNGTVMVIPEKEQSETNMVGSEDMELNISHILEKIERFTQLVIIILFFWLVQTETIMFSGILLEYMLLYWDFCPLTLYCWIVCQ